MTRESKQVMPTCWVELSGFGDGVEKFYLVEPRKAEPAENRIANTCPLAQNLIGTPVGESVTVDVPQGPLELTVVDCGALKD